MNYRSILMALCCASALTVSGQVKVKMGGRLYLDGGFYTNAPTGFSSAAEISDIRITSKVTLDDGWYAKLDVSYADNKVRLKDVFIQKAIKDHYFRVGHMFGMFSMEQSNSSNDFLFITPTMVANMFGPSRRMGVSYTYSVPHYYFSTGAFMGDKLHFDKEIKQGFNATARFVYRPAIEPGRFLHVGAGGFYRKPDHPVDETNHTLELSTTANTSLSSPDVFDFQLPNFKDAWQWNVEVFGQLGKFFMQGEYMQMRVNRNGAPGYLAHGAYLQGGMVLKGGHMAYDMLDAFSLCSSEKGSVLLFGRVSITDLNDGEVCGGMVKDASIGLNYYMTKHLIFRVNYSHQWADKHTAVGDTNWGLMQGRVQLKF